MHRVKKNGEMYGHMTLTCFSAVEAVTAASYCISDDLHDHARRRETLPIGCIHGPKARLESSEMRSGSSN